ncbi:Putative riboflavin biosynthesis protein RibF [Bradyrhizobium ivorense]|uniref:FAD synthase n=1 Tax=Bradyrhizobium ivorense TaxID=2511166 RepID=A0A508TCZ8_9BRAD|nr:FAD synthetase [Bradyrhizobium ivorense]VIO72669.1 Putative riboflavin biosynthesis protein RibF [Bradyrhizobium ivorense]
MGKGFGSDAVALHRAGELGLPASVVTIGAFDGVHRGHQELLRQTITAAQRRGVPAVVYTFDPPPKVYFGQAEALTSLAEKLERIATFGPDHVIVAGFDRVYARRTAADFIAELQRLHPHEVIVGEDFRFGACKSGTARALRHHFHTHVLPSVRCSAGEIVSSSRIRALRRSGLAAAAAALENWKDVLAAPPANRPSQLEVATP